MNIDKAFKVSCGIYAVFISVMLFFVGSLMYDIINPSYRCRMYIVGDRNLTCYEDTIICGGIDFAHDYMRKVDCDYERYQRQTRYTPVHCLFYPETHRITISDIKPRFK